MLSESNRVLLGPKPAEINPSNPAVISDWAWAEANAPERAKPIILLTLIFNQFS
jgi:hypothetical protein